MKFSTNEDIEASAEFVYEQLTDFQAYERQALRRGVDVRRLDTGPYKVGSEWDVAFTFRGTDRKMRARIDEKKPTMSLRVITDSSGLHGTTVMEIVPLSLKRTRISVSIDIKPKTLSARLLLQSLKLAKTNLTNRFKRRVADLGSDIEERFKAEAS